MNHIMSTRHNCAILVSNFEHAVPDSITQDEVVRKSRESKLGDGFCCWLDHMQGDMEIPVPEDGETFILTFWPNNPYNERRASQRKVTVEEYIAWAFHNIEKLQQKMGDDFIWCIGWETFNSHTWCNEDGSPLHLNSRNEGFDFYRKWVSSSLHTKHWRNSVKFGDARFNGRPSALEFLSQKNMQPQDFNIALGCQTACHAHYAFEAFPWLKTFWFEGGITSVNCQVGFCYARGASRQYDRKWIADISPFSYPYPLHEGTYYRDLGEWGRFEGGANNCSRLNFPKYAEYMTRLAGYSASLLQRCWLSGLMHGADYVFEEASSLSHFVKINHALQLTPHGQAAAKVAEFNRQLPEEFKILSPVKLLLDFNHGIEPAVQEKAWAHCPVEVSDFQILKFFDTAYPGHSKFPKDFPWKDQHEYGKMLLDKFDFRPYERKLLCNGRWPDIFDVHLNRSHNPDAYSEGDVILLLGQHALSRQDEKILLQLAERGAKIIFNTEHISADSELLLNEIKLSNNQSSSFLAFAAAGRRIMENSIYNITRVTGNWDSLYKNEFGFPILLKREIGKGVLYLCTVPYALNNDHSLLNCFVQFLDGVFQAAVPFSINGDKIQLIINKTNDGYLLTLINNEEKDWHGEIVGKRQNPISVGDIWNDTPMDWQCKGDDFSMEISVPRFDIRVIKINNPG